ncbi:PAS domain-containing protein [Arcticibacter sp. MXS-1]|uniref:PAS domain-containing protein n=1 Tax=Arcticibacter sp. MXS-1 TaxID=3341726 RepID=UPI0035A90AF0
MDKVDFEQASSSPRSPLRDLELLTAALNSSISGIIITDNQLRDNPIIYCNHTFEKMTGYSRHEIIGRNCRFLQMDDREQPERASLRRAVEEGRECLVEIRNYHKNGTLFWNELYIAPIKNKDGIITHFIGIQNDVSRRKKPRKTFFSKRRRWRKKLKNGHRL